MQTSFKLSMPTSAEHSSASPVVDLMGSGVDADGTVTDVQIMKDTCGILLQRMELSNNVVVYIPLVFGIQCLSSFFI